MTSYDGSLGPRLKYLAVLSGRQNRQNRQNLKRRMVQQPARVVLSVLAVPIEANLQYFNFPGRATTAGSNSSANNVEPDSTPASASRNTRSTAAEGRNDKRPRLHISQLLSCEASVGKLTRL